MSTGGKFANYKLYFEIFEKPATLTQQCTHVTTNPPVARSLCKPIRWQKTKEFKRDGTTRKCDWPSHFGSNELDCAVDHIFCKTIITNMHLRSE